MIKTERADKLLRGIYDLHDSGEILDAQKRAEERRVSRAAAEGMPSMVDFLPLDFEEDYAQLAEKVGLAKTEYLTSLQWLVARGLAACDEWEYCYQREEWPSKLPQLTATGEDIVDLGIDVDVWYRDTYAPAKLGEAIVSAES